MGLRPLGVPLYSSCHKIAIASDLRDFCFPLALDAVVLHGAAVFLQRVLYMGDGDFLDGGCPFLTA